jgi:hypothetical protein
VAGRRDHHAQNAEVRSDHDLGGGRILGVIVERLGSHLVAGTEHEPRPLRHECDRHVEQEIALAEGITGVGLPVEAVVLVFRHAKRSTPVERFKLCDESDGPSYCA